MYTYSNIIKEETVLAVKYILTEIQKYDSERIKCQISDHLAETLSPEPNKIIKLILFLYKTHLINQV